MAALGYDCILSGKEPGVVDQFEISDNGTEFRRNSEQSAPETSTI